MLGRFITLCRYRQQLVCVWVCPHTCSAQLVMMLGARVQRSEPGFIMACPLLASTHAISLSAALRKFSCFLSCPPCPPVSPAPYCPLSCIFKPNSPSRPVSIQSHPLCPHLCLRLFPHGLLTWCIHLLPHVEKRENNRTIS